MLVQDIDAPINDRMNDNDEVELHGPDRQQQQPPIASLYLDVNSTSTQDNTLRSRPTILIPVSASSSRTLDSRIDRIEGVMEQLVILNAAQAQRGAASAAAMSSSDTRQERNHHSTNNNAIADSLKQELSEIRGKMEERG